MPTRWTTSAPRTSRRTSTSPASRWPAQEAGLSVLGYTSQAHFLFNCGLLELAADADRAQQAAMQKLVNEHEMGELFKVIGLARRRLLGCDGLHARRPHRPPVRATARPGPAYTARMIRWFIVVFLALMLISWLTPLLQRLGFGRLPGDLRFKLFGRDWNIPLASTVLLSMVAAAIARLF